MFKMRFRKAVKPYVRVGFYLEKDLLDKAKSVLNPLNISLSSVVEVSLAAAIKRIEKKNQKNI
jgi:hypothetical protein